MASAVSGASAPCARPRAAPGASAREAAIVPRWVAPKESAVQQLQRRRSPAGRDRAASARKRRTAGRRRRGSGQSRPSRGRQPRPSKGEEQDLGDDADAPRACRWSRRRSRVRAPVDAAEAVERRVARLGEAAGRHDEQTPAGAAWLADALPSARAACSPAPRHGSTKAAPPARRARARTQTISRPREDVERVAAGRRSPRGRRPSPRAASRP